MKILRLVTVVLFAVVLVVFGIFFVSDRVKTDLTYPEIKIDTELLEVDVNVTDEELLQGVTAYDKKDGDLSSKVVVESVSRFIEKGECIVTYAVADSDKHVAKNTRLIRYINYSSPKFVMNRSLLFSPGDTVDILGAIGAKDVIDGNISDRVVISATDFNDNALGVYSLSVQVMNSMGDVSYLDIPIYIENISLLAPVIELKSYLVYAKKGQTLDFNSYVSRISFQNGESKDSVLEISTDYNPAVPGIYSVHYYATRAGEYTGHNVLTVIVEE